MSGYKWGKRSVTNISQCHPVLQELAHKSLETSPRDFTIICGHRGMAEQNRAYAEGKSKLKFPQSKHNSTPAMAFDFAPWPLDWTDITSFIEVGEHILQTFEQMPQSTEWDINWGGNWKRFKDYPHIEISKKK
jgi:peptidoglycan L-alanyl-D-glutamate endopeptidase CwlK